MRYVLRVVLANRWLDLDAWRQAGRDDAPADPVRDFDTKGNSLSCWYVDMELTRLSRIQAALAVGRQTIEKLDAVLFSDEILLQLGCHLEDLPGVTEDMALNVFHVDISQLTASTLSDLVIAVFRSPETLLIRAEKEDVIRAIRESVEEGYLHLERLPDKIRKALGFAS